MLILPSGITCQVIEIKDLKEITCSFLKSKIDKNNRYTCIFYNQEVKCYAMILSIEALKSENVMLEIKEGLARDIYILKQL